MSNLSIAQRILTINSDDEFLSFASEVYNHQLKNNEIFARFVSGVNANDRASSYLPIELFKYYRVSCEPTEEAIFLSSGTTSDMRSKHHVFDLELYRTLSMRHFETLFGSLGNKIIYALLPSYQEQGDSSLIWMINEFMKASRPESQFVSDDFQTLASLLSNQSSNDEVLLFGVSYALLDFAGDFSIDQPNLSIMETGGMKGRRSELTREELHIALQKSFPSSSISSEYGMTELLSQAYLIDGKFSPPPWMQVVATNVSDPLEVLPPGKRGILAVTDLANYHSCSFIQTKDVGIVDDDGRFVVEGRLDHSDIRGCNLLYT